MRILVIGHGLIGKQRARALDALARDPAIERLGGVRLAGTVDPQPRPADAYGGAPHFASLDEVDPASFDAAVIAVPHHLIAGMAARILGQRKPALLEKPLGLNLEEAQTIASLAAATEKPCYVGYSFRFLPTLRKAFARVAEGSLGKLRSVDLIFAHGGHPQSGNEWKLRPEAAGGGVLIDPGVHVLDLALCLVPGATAHAAAASTGFWKTGIEEDVHVILTRGDVVITVRASVIRWANTFRCDIVGEDGYAMIDGRGGTYGNHILRFGKRWAWADGRGLSQRASEEVFDLGTESRYLEEETRAVVEAWLTGKPEASFPHPATIDEALDVARLCDVTYTLLRR
jgi:1,5-anhydro-D-fructose reductase (1,5-anhydro-D-mannitol-forming)